MQVKVRTIIKKSENKSSALFGVPDDQAGGKEEQGVSIFKSSECKASKERDI